MRYFRKQSDEAVLISQMDIWEVLLKNQTIVIFLLQVLTKQHNDFVVSDSYFDDEVGKLFQYSNFTSSGQYFQGSEAEPWWW